MTISYRRLERKDCANYRQIRLEALKLHPDSFGSKYDDEVIKPKLFFESIIEQSTSEHIMLGAFNSAMLIGITGLIAQEPDQYEIVQMYVKKEFSQKGISWQLLSLAKSCLNKSDKKSLVLTVYSSNASAINTYIRSGFEQISMQGNNIIMAYKKQTHHPVDQSKH